MRNHRDLDVWKNAMELSTRVYEMTRAFPREEVFGLSSQMRRAAVSIVSNIAEGAARQTKKEFVQFLYVAAGSASELDTQVEITRRLGFSAPATIDSVHLQLEGIKRMIHGLIRSVKGNSAGDKSPHRGKPRQLRPDHRSQITDHE
jgi:four helix bundle protein